MPKCKVTLTLPPSPRPDVSERHLLVQVPGEPDATNVLPAGTLTTDVVVPYDVQVTVTLDDKCADGSMALNPLVLPFTQHLPPPPPASMTGTIAVASATEEPDVTGGSPGPVGSTGQVGPLGQPGEATGVTGATGAAGVTGTAGP